MWIKIFGNVFTENSSSRSSSDFCQLVKVVAWEGPTFISGNKTAFPNMDFQIY